MLPNGPPEPSPHARFIARSVCEPGQVAGEECGLRQVSGGGAPSSPRWGFSQGTDLPTVGEPGRGTYFLDRLYIRQACDTVRELRCRNMFRDRPQFMRAHPTQCLEPVDRDFQALDGPKITLLI